MYTLLENDKGYHFQLNGVDYPQTNAKVINSNVSQVDFERLSDARYNTPASHKIVISNDLTFAYVYVEPPPVCPIEEAKARQSEMKAELAWATIQREYHLTGDVRRMVISMDNLSAYSIACRDHVQVIEGVLTIVGEKPTRPIAPKIE